MCIGVGVNCKGVRTDDGEVQELEEIHRGSVNIGTELVMGGVVGGIQVGNAGVDIVVDIVVEGVSCQEEQVGGFASVILLEHGVQVGWDLDESRHEFLDGVGSQVGEVGKVVDGSDGPKGC